MRDRPSNATRGQRGTLTAMQRAPYFFASFWFSHRPAVGEAGA